MKDYNKTILVITDGIGHNISNSFNAFSVAKKPTYDYFFKNVPHSLIKTSGIAVGLPKGQMGNSEVGHMCIGSGRVLYQNLVRISMSLEDKSLEKNTQLLKLFTKVNIVNIIGLLSDGGVHSHIDHIIGLAKIARDNGKKVFLHVITDGRDVTPSSGINFINRLLQICDNNISIATICGRFYAMDRDNRWERVQSAYNVMVNATEKTSISPDLYMKSMYNNKITDEFITPIAFDDFNGIDENDGVIFANFRNDRMKEIVCAIGETNFTHFERKSTIKQIITMTRYDKNFNYPVLFETTKVENTLPQIISQAGINQFHTAETEKYAHVTFFFNGGVETPEINETRVLIPSLKVKTYDEAPQMSAKEVANAVINAIHEEYGFIVVNFANGDMVGHTGNMEATIKAVEAVDFELGRVYKYAKEKNYSYIQISDHGNCEAMKDLNSGEILTNHTIFDVYCFVDAPNVKKVNNGSLANVAATVLKLIGLEKPKDMENGLI